VQPAASTKYSAGYASPSVDPPATTEELHEKTSTRVGKCADGSVGFTSAFWTAALITHVDVFLQARVDAHV
jgi:hypothetical protein